MEAYKAAVMVGTSVSVSEDVYIEVFMMTLRATLGFKP